MLLSWLKSTLSPKASRETGPQEHTEDLAELLRQATASRAEGRLEEAVHAYHRILQRAPDHVDALTSLATTLHALNRFSASVEPLQRALALSAPSAELCTLLGTALLNAGDPVGARAALVQATLLAPKDPVAYSNLGDYLGSLGEYEAAVTALEQALAINPAFDRALEQLAHLRLKKGDIDASVEAFRRLVSRSNAGASVHHAFGNALMAAGDGKNAIQHYKRAIKLEPERANAQWALAMAQVRPMYDDLEDMQASRRAFAKALDELDAWFTPERMAMGPGAVGSTQPFYLAYQACNNLELMRRYGRLCARLAQAKARLASVPEQRSASNRKLRVGIVSSQVRNHSVWHAITKGWVEHLDPSRFEVHIFHLSRYGDAETAMARREATDFVDTPRNLDDWSQTLREAEMDVLIYPEIGMDTLTTQLAAQRLAPVQAASWGHPHTTGLETMDLFLSAELLEPALGDAHYSERLVRLPNLGVCVTPLQSVAALADLADLGLPNDEPLLLCPGVLFKYRCEHDRVWAALGKRLRERGSGRLVFFLSHRGAMAQQFEKRLRAAFKQAGVHFDKTVCLIPNLPRDQFHGLMQRATLMLDTIGFSGFNTALQGIECALPVVAYEGEFMRGRLASGLLQRMGLNEWVARSDTEFVDLAMRLVADEGLQRSVREQIAQRRSALFHDLAPVRALEQVLLDAVATSYEQRVDVPSKA